jgi:hypothetical protein
MAKTFTAPFAQSPKTATAVLTAACVIGTAGTPTNTALLCTAGAEGALVTDISAIPQSTLTATGLVLFLSTDAGTTKWPIDSETMAAYSAGTTAKIPKTPFAAYTEQTPLRLTANARLYVGTLVAAASGIVFKAQSTDF